MLASPAMLTTLATVTRVEDLGVVEGVLSTRVALMLPRMQSRAAVTASMVLAGDHAAVLQRLPGRGVGVELLVTGTCWPAAAGCDEQLQIEASAVGVSLSDASWPGAGTQPPLPWDVSPGASG